MQRRKRETADYTTSCTITVDPGNGNMYIRDWTREHISLPEQQQSVIQMNNKWRPSVIGIEDVGYQAALPQSLGKHMLPLRGIKRIKDKVTRITAAFTAFEQGMVYLPTGHQLLGEFENEYAYLPTGKHDDLLDATEIAISLARSGANPYTETDASYNYSIRGNPDRYKDRMKTRSRPYSRR